MPSLRPLLIAAQAFPPATGGIEDLMRGLAVHAAEAGAPTHVLADVKPGWQDFDPKAPFTIRRFGGPRPWRRWRKARAVAALGREAGPEHLLFADSWKSIEALDRAAWPGKVAVWAHGNEFPDHDRKNDRIRAALAKADVIVPNSRDTEGRLQGRLPAGAAVRLAHPPVFAPAPDSAEDRAWAEAQWTGTGGGRPRCLTMCRHVEWKGVDRAIEAIAALGRGTLLIGGDGPQRQALEALAASLGVSDRVRFLGRIPDGRRTALQKSTDVFLQAGRRVGDQCEGYGIAYLEAALHGKPAISGDAGGAPEAALHDRTALVVDAARPEPVAEALRRLTEDQALYARLSAAAKAHAEANLWTARIAGLLEIAEARP